MSRGSSGFEGLGLRVAGSRVIVPWTFMYKVGILTLNLHVQTDTYTNHTTNMLTLEPKLPSRRYSFHPLSELSFIVTVFSLIVRTVVLCD